MTFNQIEYLLALDKHRSFVKAAKKSFVSQPAMTMQIQKLEEELGVILFDRSKKPLIPTEVGTQLITQAKTVHIEVLKMKYLVSSYMGEIAGILNLAIIPTLAPYLVPRFANRFTETYPKVKLRIRETETDQMISELKSGELDVGVAVTPIEESKIVTLPLFYEPIWLLVSPQHSLSKKSKIHPSDLQPEGLFLLREGNCFRTQTLNICAQASKKVFKDFDYESASLESLKRVVIHRGGYTLIPELAKDNLSKDEENFVKPFLGQTPVREVSFVLNRDFIKKRIVEKLQEEIQLSVSLQSQLKQDEIIVNP